MIQGVGGQRIHVVVYADKVLRLEGYLVGKICLFQPRVNAETIVGFH